MIWSARSQALLILRTTCGTETPTGYAALFALATGVAALVDLHVGVAAHQAISTHLKWAIFTTLALVLLAVWRGAGSPWDARPAWPFVVLLLAAAAALGVTGYRGGQNVYRFGVGVHGAVSAVHPVESSCYGCFSRTEVIFVPCTGSVSS